MSSHDHISIHINLCNTSRGDLFPEFQLTIFCDFHIIFTDVTRNNSHLG